MDHIISTHPTMEERLRFETLLADLSTRFVNIPADEIDAQIVDNLKHIAQVLEIDRCSVAEYNSDKTKLSVTHWYAAPGVARMPDVVINKEQPWYNKKFMRGESIIVSDWDSLPDEAVLERAYWRKQGIKSSMLIPLAVGGTFLGVVGFASLRAERHWDESLVQRLELLGQVFANALMRKRAEEELYNAFTEIKALKERLEAENIFLREEITLKHPPRRVHRAKQHHQTNPRPGGAGRRYGYHGLDSG